MIQSSVQETIEGGLVLSITIEDLHVQAYIVISKIDIHVIEKIIPQTIFIIVKLARGGEVRWLGVFFNLTVTLTVGVIGGFIGSAMQKTGATPKGRRT